ncbi:hypothetical protein [Nannocystis pusilla]|uniref:hypothetical protein n=1 Tax=Nannocystis pusilla TaxID=889268 RepID=UPI003B78EB4D
MTILGRDGGFDYGGLITSRQATPLELYLAVAPDDVPVPEALQLAHDWQITVEGRPDLAPRPLAVPGADPLAAFEDILHTDQSDFTCLSWANFQSYMGSRFAGAPGRVQELGSATGSATIYNPHPQLLVPGQPRRHGRVQLRVQQQPRLQRRDPRRALPRARPRRRAHDQLRPSRSRRRLLSAPDLRADL